VGTFLSSGGEVTYKCVECLLADERVRGVIGDLERKTWLPTIRTLEFDLSACKSKVEELEKELALAEVEHQKQLNDQRSAMQRQRAQYELRLKRETSWLKAEARTARIGEHVSYKRARAAEVAWAIARKTLV
jgi:hypothetical protein